MDLKTVSDNLFQKTGIVKKNRLFTKGFPLFPFRKRRYTKRNICDLYNEKKKRLKKYTFLHERG